MNDKANAQTMTGNADTTTMADDENVAAEKAKAAVNRFILRRHGRMMPMAIGVGLFLGALAATAVYFLEKYDYLIFRNGGRHQIVIDGRQIDIGISPEDLERIRGFAAEIGNISYAVIVTAMLLVALTVGAVIQGAYAAIRTRTYLSSGFPRRSILLAHAKAFGLGTAVSGALAMAGAAVHGLIAGDFSGSIKVTGTHAGRTVGTYEVNLWFLAVVATVAIAGAYTAAYGIFMAFVRLPWYVAGIGVAVVSATWGTLNWTFKAVGSDGSLIYVAPFKHIGASGFPLYSVLWDLASIVFYAAAAWLCMRRIQVRR